MEGKHIKNVLDQNICDNFFFENINKISSEHQLRLWLFLKIIYFSEWDFMFNQWQSCRLRHQRAIRSVLSPLTPALGWHQIFREAFLRLFSRKILWNVDARFCWLAGTAINKPITCEISRNISRLLMKIIDTDVYSPERTFKSESTISCAHSRLPFLLCENICLWLLFSLQRFLFCLPHNVNFVLKNNFGQHLISFMWLRECLATALCSTFFLRHSSFSTKQSRFNFMWDSNGCKWKWLFGKLPFNKKSFKLFFHFENNFNFEDIFEVFDQNFKYIF